MQDQYTKPYAVLARVAQKSQLIKQFERLHGRSPTMEEVSELLRSGKITTPNSEGWDL